jgi:hypothetical protein
MLEKDIGSAVLLGFCEKISTNRLYITASILTLGEDAGSACDAVDPIPLLCLITGDATFVILGDCENPIRFGWECEAGECPGKFAVSGDVWFPL